MAADPDDIAERLLAAILERLRAIRERLVGVLATFPQPISPTDLQRSIVEVDRLLLSWADDAMLLTRDAITTAATAGDEQVLDTLRAARLEVPLGYIGVSDSLVRVSQDYTASLIRDVSADGRRRIAQSIRRAVLGGTSFDTLVTQIGRDLDQPGTAMGEMRHRATDIARTEVSRIYNTSYWEQSVEAANRYPDLRKVWDHVENAPGLSDRQRRNSRPDHIAMSRATQAEPIPVDALFVFPDGTAMRHPHDPNAPAKHVVGCRCRSRLIATEPEGL